jgi:hypothetical protein
LLSRGNPKRGQLRVSGAEDFPDRLGVAIKPGRGLGDTSAALSDNFHNFSLPIRQLAEALGFPAASRLPRAGLRKLACQGVGNLPDILSPGSRDFMPAPAQPSHGGKGHGERFTSVQGRANSWAQLRESLASE